MHEFMLWRDELRSVDDIGIFSVIERNLRWQDAAGAPVRGAAISAAAFRVAGVPAQIGRTLVAADEEFGAAPVVVLGHDVCRGAFASAPDIVGRQVRVGGEPHTVVGVMPEGFAFPISESFWVPFRLTSSSYVPLEGPPIRTFGRLAPDANLEAAQAELTTATQRVVLANPETHQQLRAQVLPFANEVMDISSSVASRPTKAPTRPSTSVSANRLGHEELRLRLETEPGVGAVTLADRPAAERFSRYGTVEAHSRLGAGCSLVCGSRACLVCPWRGARRRDCAGGATGARPERRPRSVARLHAWALRGLSSSGFESLAAHHFPGRIGTFALRGGRLTP